MDNTCQEINKLIENNKFSQAIFVYHSFGGSITAWFCSLFPEKVKGLICLGGTPIRFYPILRDYAKAYLSIPDINRKFIIENYEVVYALYD
jgi:pimeloyl-ACP methyl ester carboxylesterase